MTPEPLYLYDDEQTRRGEPFALTRPWGEVRAGGCLVRERWARALGRPVAGHLTSPHLAGFSEFDSPATCPADAVLAGGSLVALARFAPSLTPAGASAGTSRWVSGGQVVAVRLAQAVPAAAFADGRVALASFAGAGATVELAGWMMERPWDLVRHLAAMLAADIPALVSGLACRDQVPGERTGTHSLHVETGATVEPWVFFDLSAGPVLVRRGASIGAFTRLAGPCVVSADAQVLGGRVVASSIGEQCRVHGEVSHTIFIGHANKGHDGFVGHSVLGRWANLGAGTITSNLKNTYGPVQAWGPDGMQETGMQFLGSLIGDHARTAIGTRLTTAAVVGAGANVLHAGLGPKVIAPFAFGSELYALDKFLEVAERVMARRGVALDESMRSVLVAAHARRWAAP